MVRKSMEVKRRKIWQSGGNLIISLPRDVVRHYSLAAGDEVDAYCFDHKLIVDLKTAGKPKPFVAPVEVETAA
jgi:hypothetical protein